MVDEQNRHTQVQRMSSSSSIKRENSEELKDAEPRKFGLNTRKDQDLLLSVVLIINIIIIIFCLCPGQVSLSPTSPIVLEKPESLNTVTFSEESV